MMEQQKHSLRDRLVEWVAGHTLWEILKLSVTAAAAWIGSYAGARLMHSTTGTALNVFLLVLGVLGVAWGIGFLPIGRGSGHRGYSLAEMPGKISVFLVGFGPQLNVTPEKGHLTIETIQLAVVNFLPFPIDLESMQMDILLDGTNLTTKEANIHRVVAGSSIDEFNLRHELTDNQARIARDYRDRVSPCPIFKIGGKAHFRTPRGVISIRIETGIRCVINKDS
jgi:hypothetical protein